VTGWWQESPDLGEYAASFIQIENREEAEYLRLFDKWMEYYAKRRIVGIGQGSVGDDFRPGQHSDPGEGNSPRRRSCELMRRPWACTTICLLCLASQGTSGVAARDFLAKPMPTAAPSSAKPCFSFTAIFGHGFS
jgi:hypothetical protein